MTTFLKDPIWFSPVNVIHHFIKLEQSPDFVKDSKSYKKACEMYVTAINLVGIIKITGRQSWLQLVDDSEGSPDIRTGCYFPKNRDDDFASVDVEVVTYEQNSSESLVDFLLRTKLSPKKSYDDLTTILCHVHKITNISSWKEINEELKSKNLKTKSPVMVMGKSSPDKSIYTIIQIYPAIDLFLTFDLVEECKKIKQPGVLRLGRTLKPGYRPDDRHYPFEKIENIKKYAKF